METSSHAKEKGIEKQLEWVSFEGSSKLSRRDLSLKM
jgi:hypothetical protein